MPLLRQEPEHGNKICPPVQFSEDRLYQKLLSLDETQPRYRSNTRKTMALLNDQQKHIVNLVKGHSEEKHLSARMSNSQLAPSKRGCEKGKMSNEDIFNI
jgi:hypothetical protein